MSSLTLGVTFADGGVLWQGTAAAAPESKPVNSEDCVHCGSTCGSTYSASCEYCAKCRLLNKGQQKPPSSPCTPARKADLAVGWSQKDRPEVSLSPPALPTSRLSMSPRSLFAKADTGFQCPSIQSLIVCMLDGDGFLDASELGALDEWTLDTGGT